MSATGLPPAADMQQNASFVDCIPAGAPADPSTPLADGAFVEFVSAHELGERVADLQTLADDTAEPNVFFEPWMLLPAVKTFSGQATLRFALVSRRSSRRDTRPVLCGFFPLEERRRWRGLPVRVWSLWQHPYSFLSTPLIRSGQGTICIAALLDALSHEPGRPAVLDLPDIDGAGPFHRALTDVISERALNAFCVSERSRAFLETGDDWQQYVAESLTSHNRRELRRQRRRLAEQGDIAVRVNNGNGFFDYWMEQFLDLEAAGWKGEAGTAIGLDERHRQFFREITCAAAERKQLMLLGLFLNNEPVAMKWNFRSAAGSFAFKIAYDEKYARFSPGVHLEIENIRVLQQMPSIRWMDSCAVPQHFMINRLWRQRRTIRHVLVSTGRLAGDAVVGLAPLARVVRRRLRTSSRRIAAIQQT
ncbi:MAG: GNAT family N-acetyltransferase [Maioricimonas sp. JB049]